LEEQVKAITPLSAEAEIQAEQKQLEEARKLVESYNSLTNLEELTLEQQVDKVIAAVIQQPLNREVLYKILKHCKQRQLLHDLEEHIATYPEFSQITQPQYHLIIWLVDQGGLTQFELDINGQEVTEAQKIGLSEDQIDDLVEYLAFETTEAGAIVVEELNPTHRLIDLLDIVPEWYDTYVEILGFLEERRSFAEVDTLLRGRDTLLVGRAANDRPIQPSVFIDKLEAAGGITWNDGWKVSEEGRELLKTIKERREE
jgi:hypothetical protein